MKATRTPKNKCLACHASIDAATDMFGDDVPEPGAITICVKCGHIMGFNKDLTVRELTDAEMLDVAGDQRILKIQAARSVLRDRRK